MQKSFTKNQDGGDVDENAVLHSENAFCVGLLGAIHKKMNYILKTFPCCARSLHHLIEKGGDDLAKINDFQSSLIVSNVLQICRAARAALSSG